ncbi:hypothetical protein HYV43_03790 [Candidatus Micrarchaeota archaeon]|nr:hypothetical protein [Candidatus Micrarchaeota archaeon]
MVGVLEAGLVVGALGLDIYAYKKMKDAEAAAEDAVRQRERDRFKTTAGVHVEVHPEPAAAGSGAATQDDTHVQTALSDHNTADEHAEAHADWKPVTYESVAPVQTEEEHTTVTRTAGDLDADEIKKQYQSIGERLDVIDERLSEQDSKISVIETKFDHVESEVTKAGKQLTALDEQWRQIDEQLKNVEIPQDQIEVIIDKRFSKSNERLNSQVKEQSKKLAQVEAKLDSHIIATPETALIKKDLREEFAPLLKEPKTALEAHAAENRKEFKALSVRITQARDAALQEAKNKASKTDVRRIVAAIQTTATARKTVAKAPVKAKATTVKNIVTKKSVRTTKTSKATKIAKTVTPKKKTAEKPKSKIQSAAHEFAKSRKSKKSVSSSEVTVTTSVPKGVNVSTEVVTGGKKD